MLYQVTKGSQGVSSLTLAERTTMTKESLMEVQDLQEWIVAHPLLLNYPDGKIDPIIIGKSVYLGSKYIDILAVDRDGTIIICETKRSDSDPLYQALCYVGILSAMEDAELDTIISKRYPGGIPGLEKDLKMTDEAGEEIHLKPLWERLKRKFRITLYAEEYDPNVLKTAHWLISNGLDLIVFRATLFRIDGNIYFQPQRILPSIETAQAYQAQMEVAVSVRSKNMFRSIITDGTIRHGEEVYDIEGNPIGKVAEDGIVRYSSDNLCINMWQLIGTSWWGGAFVKRNDKLVALNELPFGTSEDIGRQKSPQDG